MELKEVREAYRDILRFYNALFPLHPERRTGGVDVEEGCDLEEENFCADAFRKKATKVLSRLKDVADQSGNAVIWRRGESFESLNYSLRNRIEKALKFGI